jgi:hypothetical protein
MHLPTYMRQATRRLRPLAVASVVAWATGVSAPAWSGPDVRNVPILKEYANECAACHMAYPPGLLGAPAWGRIMSGLDKHYGSDASLDADTVRKISMWLEANASRRRGMQNPPEDRITTSEWFVREHRQFTQQDWAHPSVGGASNCMACHQGADRYGFDDDNVRLPVGVGRNSWWR